VVADGSGLHPTSLVHGAAERGRGSVTV
jgi:hypothetical protein